MPENFSFLWNVLISLLSGLAGAGIGVAGARWVEERREKRQQNVAMWAVLSEMALLAATLENAAEDQSRTRIELRKPLWDRFGVELINYLPVHVVKILSLLMDDQFDVLQRAYSAISIGKGVTNPEWEGIRAKFLWWSQVAIGVQQVINEYFEAKHKKWFPWRSTLDEGSPTKKLAQELDNKAFGYLRQRGFQVDENGNMPGGPMKLDQDLT